MSPGKCDSVWGRAWEVFLVTEGSPLQECLFKTGRILLKYLNWIFFFCQICWKITMQMSTFIFRKGINWDSAVSHCISFCSWELGWKVFFMALESFRFFILSYSRSCLRRTCSHCHGEKDLRQWLVSIWWKCVPLCLFCIVRWWEKV